MLTRSLAACASPRRPPPYAASPAGGGDLNLGASVTSGSTVIGFNPFASIGGWGYHVETCGIAATYGVTFPAQPVSQYMYFNRACGRGCAPRGRLATRSLF